MNWTELKVRDIKRIRELGVDAEFVGTKLVTVTADGWRIRRGDYGELSFEVPRTTYEKSAYRCEYVHPKTGEKHVRYQEHTTPDEALEAYGFVQTDRGGWIEHTFDIETDEPVDAGGIDR